MILPFSTNLNGQPTYFVERILKSIEDKKFSVTEMKMIKSAILKGYLDVLKMEDIKPKIHTIREDKKDRWKPGTMIDFFINTRKPNMFRFAPRIPVVDIQEVFMTYFCNDIIEISVDGTYINNITEFALNDGFDTWSDFFNYFYPIIESNKNKCFKGKIIHWTDKLY